LPLKNIRRTKNPVVGTWDLISSSRSKAMRTPFVLRWTLALSLCLILTLPASPQSGGYGSIGPGKGEVIGGIAGGAAVLGAVGYLIYHETHKHTAVTGCLASSGDGLSLTSETGKEVYALTGNLATLQAGKRVGIRGKKSKDSNGKLVLRVEKVVKDLGSCQP
jgi:hypothetical protein